MMDKWRNFKEGIIDPFARGIIKKSETTFGNIKADVLALKDPSCSEHSSKPQSDT